MSSLQPLSAQALIEAAEQFGLQLYDELKAARQAGQDVDITFPAAAATCVVSVGRQHVAVGFATVPPQHLGLVIAGLVRHALVRHRLAWTEPEPATTAWAPVASQLTLEDLKQAIEKVYSSPEQKRFRALHNNVFHTVAWSDV